LRRPVVQRQAVPAGTAPAGKEEPKKPDIRDLEVEQLLDPRVSANAVMERELGGLIYDHLDGFGAAIDRVTDWAIDFLDRYIAIYGPSDVEDKDSRAGINDVLKNRDALTAARRSGDYKSALDAHYTFADAIYTGLAAAPADPEKPKGDRRYARVHADLGVEDVMDPKDIRKKVPGLKDARGRVPEIPVEGEDENKRDPALDKALSTGAAGDDRWKVRSHEVIKKKGEPDQYKETVFGQEAVKRGLPIRAGLSGTASDFASVGYNAGLRGDALWAYAVATGGRMIFLRHHAFDEVFQVLSKVTNGVVTYERGDYLSPFRTSVAKPVRDIAEFDAWQKKHAKQLHPGGAAKRGPAGGT
jgi:hypothetical protein